MGGIGFFYGDTGLFYGRCRALLADLGLCLLGLFLGCYRLVMGDIGFLANLRLCLLGLFLGYYRLVMGDIGLLTNLRADHSQRVTLAGGRVSRRFHSTGTTAPAGLRAVTVLEGLF
jgi:hypothetical protein